jgi:NADH dehydrogenase [ubiquinone] 1 alpha subcomplex assembly factor 7
MVFSFVLYLHFITYILLLLTFLDYTFILANEYLDALPVFAFKTQKDGLKEYMVDVDETEMSKHHFQMTLSDSETNHSKLYGKMFALQDEQMESEHEVSPDALLTLKRSCDIISAGKGTAIFIDYGYEMARNKLSLRGYLNHKMVSIFEKPGESDLTYDVNFNTLQRIVSAQPQHSCLNFQNFSQKDFLLNFGIAARAAKLIKNNPQQREAIESSVSKLVDDMGTLFRVLVVESA